MVKTESKKIISRIIINYYFISIAIVILTYLFFKNILYSGFVLGSSLISGFSFYILIRLIDKLISNKISKAKFFVFTILKIIVIGFIFVVFSKISEKFAILFILGFSSVIISIMVEGFYLFVRSIFNGRA